MLVRSVVAPDTSSLALQSTIDPVEGVVVSRRKEGKSRVYGGVHLYQHDRAVYVRDTATGLSCPTLLRRESTVLRRLRRIPEQCLFLEVKDEVCDPVLAPLNARDSPMHQAASANAGQSKPPDGVTAPTNLQSR